MTHSSRGWLLTLLVILAAGSGVSDFIKLIVFPDQYEYLKNPSLAAYFFGFPERLTILLIGMIVLWNVWLWKKWAVYAKFALDAVAALVVLFFVLYVDPVEIALAHFGSAAVGTLLTDLLWLWAINHKWKYFT